MRKLVSFLGTLLVLMGLLVGCNEKPDTEVTGTTISTVPQETGNSQAEEETAPSFVYTEYPDPMLDLPKGQEYYFLCPEYDLQFNISDYMGQPTDSLTIPIISRKPIDMEEISVVLPLEHIKYEVYAEQRTPDAKMDLYLYKCYENWDWEAEARAARLYKKEENLTTEEKLTTEEQAFLEEYQNKAQEIYTQYEELSNNDLPGSLSDFYCYAVTVDFYYDTTTTQGESFSYMDVSWPGVSFRQQCGKVSFYLGQPTDYGTYISGAYTRMFAGGTGGAGSPYGLAHGSVPYYFTAEKDMVLEKVVFLDGTAQMKRIDVDLKINGTGMNLRWDGMSPLPIQAGTEVQIRIAFLDPRLATVVTGGRITLRLDYSCEGKQGNWVEYVNLFRYINCYELAAVYFDGVDVPRYYRDYYNPVLGPGLYQ